MVNDYRDLSRKSDEQEYKSRTKQLLHIYSATNQVGSHSTQATFTSVVTYPPWSYAPSLIGVTIAKTLKLPLLWYVYLGRLFSLMVWIGLTAWAIALLPRGKWFLVVLGLLPTSLTQATIVGADGLVNGLSWLIIAYTLAVFAQKFKLDWKRLILISIASLWLCLIKDGYWLIALFPLIIPAEFFIRKLHAWIWRLTNIFVLGTASLLFAIRTSHVAATTVLTPRLGVYINSKAQLHFVLHHSLFFIGHVLSQPFTKNYDTVYEGLVGIVSSRLIYLSLPMMGLLYLVLLLSLFEIQVMPKLVKYNKRLWASAFIILLGTYLLLSLAFYLGNTQVGAAEVFGVYGRYFLPLLPLLIVFPAMSTIVLKVKRSTVAFVAITVVVISLLSTLISIV